MAFINEFLDLYEAYPLECDIAFAAIGSLILYFGLRKRLELSAHAIENTVTTLIVLGLNYVVLIYFLADVNAAMQSFYGSLGIPTIDPALWESVPFWLTCIFAVAAKDFADYWNHRLMHTPWGWPTHAAHHSDTHVNGFTTFRIHFLEFMVMSTSYVFLLTWLQVPETIPVVLVLSSIHNIYVHLDLDIEHGPLKYAIASPRFHRWHHADVPEAYGKNLANIIPAYDRMFGTYYEAGPCNEKMGALETGVADKDPVSVITYPFVEWGRMIRDRLPARKERASETPAE